MRKIYKEEAEGERCKGETDDWEGANAQSRGQVTEEKCGCNGKQKEKERGKTDKEVHRRCQSEPNDTPLLLPVPWRFTSKVGALICLFCSFPEFSFIVSLQKQKK